MKAEELRIWNLVWDSYSGEMIVEHIDRRTQTVFLAKTINLPTGLYNLDKIHPIPLTEEWLLRFGFEKKSSDVFELYEYAIERNYDSVDFIFEGKIIRVIKYVHQLQNLYFALTGEELIYNQGYVAQDSSENITLD